MVMTTRRRVFVTSALIGVVLALGVPATAQQPAQPAGTPSEEPTREDPLRFTAFNVSMPTGIAGTTQITIERWTTVEERQALLELVATATPGRQGQEALLNALQDIEPRTGSIRTPNSLGWDLKYAVEFTMPDGTRQIVIATDRPVSFAAAANAARSMDYPFTLIEMRMKPGEEGEGRMLSATSIAGQDGRLQLENYGREPVRLTSIKQEQ